MGSSQESPQRPHLAQWGHGHFLESRPSTVGLPLDGEPAAEPLVVLVVGYGGDSAKTTNTSTTAVNHTRTSHWRREHLVVVGRGEAVAPHGGPGGRLDETTMAGYYRQDGAH